MWEVVGGDAAHSAAPSIGKRRPEEEKAMLSSFPSTPHLIIYIFYYFGV